MIRTFTGTLFHATDLNKAKVELLVYKHVKWNALDGEETRLTYTGLTSWDVVEGGKEAEEIEKNMIADDNHEYLVLHFENGKTLKFRNSYVSMFIW